METAQSYTLSQVNPQLDNVIREVKDLVAGRSINAEVTRPSDPVTRQFVAEQLLAAMNGPNAAEQERARKIFISHGYLDETTSRFRSSNSAADRAAAAHALGIVGSSLATAHLVAGIFDSEPEVSRAAAEALANIGDPAVSLGPLHQIISTESAQTATRNSEFGVAVLETDPELRVKREWVEPERRLANSTLTIGADVSEIPTAIVSGLVSMDPQDRVHALEELAATGGTALKVIVNFFVDPSAGVRIAATRLLYQLNPDHCGEAFGRAIEDSSQEQGQNIGAALAASGVAAKAIEALAGDSRENAYNSLCLLFAMAKTGEVRPLTEAIEQHSNSEVRRAAVKLLTLNGQSELAAAAAKRRLMAPVK